MNELPWWQRAVFYQIYPRSFADSNGDGIGDLPGITARLDYLQWLGIDAIWLSPHFPSPQYDCGYDVSDYRDVAPEYGTLADFRTLLEEAHQREIRVVLDLVMNHTSHEHAWFQASRQRQAPYSDWYVWRDPAPDGGPPNDWQAGFGGPAWTFDEARGQYYYHYFLKEQPDLNWHNPQVREAMWDVVRFWYDMGVDGFRLDAIGTIFEDAALPNQNTDYNQVSFFLQQPANPAEAARSHRQMRELIRYQHDLPQVHDVMRELRVVNDEYHGRVLIGESDDIAYYGDGSDELHLIFNFALMRVPALSADWIAANQVQRLRALPQGAWPCNTLGNHDTSRAYSAFGDGEHDDQLARLSIALMATLRGTPFFYNGEEIGMEDYLLTERGQLRDTLAILFDQLALAQGDHSPDEVFERARRLSRDRCRTPMQWAAGPNGGFSPDAVQTWLPVHPNASQGVNVAAQRADEDSLLHFFRNMLQLRRGSPALVEGDYTLLHAAAEGALVFRRATPAQTLIVALNFSGAPRPLCLSQGAGRVRFSSEEREERVALDGLTLAPFEILIVAPAASPGEGASA